MVVKLLFCENPDKLNEKMLCCMVFVLPVLTSMAVSLFQMTIELILQPWVSFMVLIGKLCISAFFMKGMLAGELYDALPHETNQCKWCGLADRHFDKSFSHSRKHNGGGISFWQI